MEQSAVVTNDVCVQASGILAAKLRQEKFHPTVIERVCAQGSSTWTYLRVLMMYGCRYERRCQAIVNRYHARAVSFLESLNCRDDAAKLLDIIESVPAKSAA